MNIDRDLAVDPGGQRPGRKSKRGRKNTLHISAGKIRCHLCFHRFPHVWSMREPKMAVQETGFGKWEDKVLKNKLGSAITWESVKNIEDGWSLKGK